MAPSEETPPEAAARLRKELGDKDLIVCILGSTKFQGAESEELVKAMAAELSLAVGSRVKFVTGGMPGVQEVFAKHCGEGDRVWNLLPVGEESSFGVGTQMNAGANLEARRAIFGLLGDLYITVEGGPGVSEEVKAAHARGAAVVPLVRTGGASSGMFDFPVAALEKPKWASETQWSLLFDKEDVVDSATAVACLVKEFANAQKTPNIWELLDELIGLDRGSLTKLLGVVLTILVVVSLILIYREVSRERYDLALLHGGFLVLLFGLVGSVAFVLTETSRLEEENKRPIESPAFVKKTN